MMAAVGAAGTYIYLVRPARERFLETMTREEETLVGLHFEYLKALLHAGRVILAGPCTDGAFGVVIFVAGTPAEAADLMGADPAVMRGMYVAELHPFTIALSDRAPSRP
jgi:uncharacterized protein YciI